MLSPELTERFTLFTTVVGTGVGGFVGTAVTAGAVVLVGGVDVAGAGVVTTIGCGETVPAGGEPAGTTVVGATTAVGATIVAVGPVVITGCGARGCSGAVVGLATTKDGVGAWHCRLAGMTWPLTQRCVPAGVEIGPAVWPSATGIDPGTIASSNAIRMPAEPRATSKRGSPRAIFMYRSPTVL